MAFKQTDKIKELQPPKQRILYDDEPITENKKTNNKANNK